MMIHSHSPQDTFQIAYELGKCIRPPFVLFLSGELGTGKTLFTQGLAKGLKIQSQVNSPTFVIMKIYEGNPRLVHVDAYRLEHSDEPIGVIDELDDNTIMIVEWPKYLNESLTCDMSVTLEYKGEHHRIIIVESDHQVVECWRSYVASRD